MGETIDSIQQKLEPGNLKQQATTAARGRASELLEAIRNNPTPVGSWGVSAGGLAGARARSARAEAARLELGNLRSEEG
jgi:hypothetical protein